MILFQMKYDHPRQMPPRNLCASRHDCIQRVNTLQWNENHGLNPAGGMKIYVYTYIDIITRIHY